MSITCLPKDILKEIYFLTIEYKTNDNHKKLISSIKTCIVEYKNEQELWVPSADHITFFDYIFYDKYPMDHLVYLKKYH